jgi:hypothetical protein
MPLLLIFKNLVFSGGSIAVVGDAAIYYGNSGGGGGRGEGRDRCSDVTVLMVLV